MARMAMTTVHIDTRAKRLLAILLALFAASFSPLGGQAAAAAEAKDRRPPNIVFILADDLGYTDVGYHQSEIKTPVIDGLAREGVRLESFYVMPVCSPTRGVVLTGRYAFQIGLQNGVIRPGEADGLDTAERTLPQALGEAGYTSYMCGKWHLGLARPELRPLARGFAHHYGPYTGAIDYFTHERDGSLDWHRNGFGVREEGYSTDLLADEAARLIAKHDAARPFFLYVPFNAVHSPLQAPPKYLEMYPSLKGQRQKYAAMTTAMDDGIGRIVAALEQKGIRENTLIIFHSDNGGPVKLGATNRGLRAGKGTVYEGGVRVVALANFPGQIPANSVVDGITHGSDWFPTLVKLAGGSIEQPRPLAGVDLWPSLTGQAPSPRHEVVINAGANQEAIRQGPWKLVRHGGKKQRSVELYNVVQDRAEETDLAAKEPERVAELSKLLDRYAQEAIAPRSGLGEPAGWKQPAIWGGEALQSE